MIKGRKYKHRNNRNTAFVPTKVRVTESGDLKALGVWFNVSNPDAEYPLLFGKITVKKEHINLWKDTGWQM